MILKDDRGNELLDVIVCEETGADSGYAPITHCLLVVRIGTDYLMGWNNYRHDWEIFGGCREEGETLRDCILRECREELGLDDIEFHFLGLAHYRLAPGYFNPEWHEEYGGLYGVTLPEEYLQTVERQRTDREEIKKVALLSTIAGSEPVSPIDKRLLDCWK